ncbi:hypothetical protein SGPA1_50517 [Streptomyces misionensis JCM 4497]
MWRSPRWAGPDICCGSATAGAICCTATSTCRRTGARGSTSGTARSSSCACCCCTAAGWCSRWRCCWSAWVWCCSRCCSWSAPRCRCWCTARCCCWWCSPGPGPSSPSRASCCRPSRCCCRRPARWSARRKPGPGTRPWWSRPWPGCRISTARTCWCWGTRRCSGRGSLPGAGLAVLGLVGPVDVLLQAQLLDQPLVELDRGPHPADRGGDEVVEVDTGADQHLRLADEADGAVVVGVGVHLRPQGAAVPVVHGLQEPRLVLDLVRTVVEGPHREDRLVGLPAEHEVGAELLPGRREVTLLVDDVLQLHLVEELLHEVLIREDGAGRSLGLRLGLAPEVRNRGRVDAHRVFPFVRILPSSPMRGGAWQAPTGPVGLWLT